MQIQTHSINSRTENVDAREQQINGFAITLSDIFTVVIGNLEILQRLIINNSKASGRVNTALKSARRGIPLTKGLLEIAHQDYPNEGAPLAGVPIGKTLQETKDPVENESRACETKD